RVTHAGPWNGGMLSTAGNLVFQGNASGEFVAYRADTGEHLWGFDAQTGIVAPPISFRYQGDQYIAVLAGWGGALPLVGGEALSSTSQPNRSRLLVFKLGGEEKLPPVVEPEYYFDPPPLTASAEDVAAGKQLYARFCLVCHGDGAVSNHVTPDLRRASRETHDIWLAIVVGGMHWQQGMVGFAEVLSPAQATLIQQYVIDRSHFATAQ
ncbi:MAG: c-type cytochrome, partial [Lysobacterales bacterium]